MEYKTQQQRFAIEKANIGKIERRLAENGYDARMFHTSGIYVVYRDSEEGLRYAYVGQATVDIVKRLAQHLTTYQHIDLSLRKRGWYDKDNNQFGYKLRVMTCPPQDCDRLEQLYIREWGNKGFQLYNHTTGSQGSGKAGMDDAKSPKGYYDGLDRGFTNARRYVARLFDKNLRVEINGKDGARKQKALEKFNEFINIKEEDISDD